SQPPPGRRRFDPMGSLSPRLGRILMASFLCVAREKDAPGALRPGLRQRYRSRDPIPGVGGVTHRAPQSCTTDRRPGPTFLVMARDRAERDERPMRHAPATKQQSARFDHSTIDGWLALFGGPDFVAQRP